jgi:hypothetical protein
MEPLTPMESLPRDLILNMASSAARNDCEKALLKIPGITSVTNEVSERSKSGRVF